MRIAVTGHRPDNVFTLHPYADVNFEKLTKFCASILVQIKETHPDLEIITGMALGFDQAMAQACIDLDIPFHAYLLARIKRKYGRAILLK